MVQSNLPDSYFSLRKETIAFFEINVSNFFQIKSVAKVDLSKFLIDSAIACGEVKDNPDSYVLSESKHWPLTGYPVFTSYLKKYHLFINDDVFPDEKYFPSFSEVDAANLILETYMNPTIGSSKERLSALNRFEESEGYDFGRPNQVYLRPYENDFIPFFSNDSFAQLILYAVVHAIHEELPIPYICPVCGKPFMPTKSDQIYCSARCKKTDQRVKHPLQNKIDSRGHMINAEVGTNPRKAHLYDEWKKQVKAMRDTYEPKVFKDIILAEAKVKHTPLTKKEFNSLPSVKEFTDEIKELWINLKKENPANGIH